MPDWHDLDVCSSGPSGGIGGARDTYARNAGLLDMSSPAILPQLPPSLIWSNSLPAYLPITLPLACFISQPNRP